MKDFLITGLAIIGGFAVFHWWKRQHRYVSGAQNSQYGFGVVSSSIATDTTTPGVPVFTQSGYGQTGHGDLVAAALPNNRYATLPGTAIYVPAFGPNENTGGTPTW